MVVWSKGGVGGDGGSRRFDASISFGTSSDGEGRSRPEEIEILTPSLDPAVMVEV